MYLTTRGLVLRVTPYNDTDAFLTILTDKHGKMTLRARGLRRKNSPLIAPCQLFCYSEFVIFQYREMNTINEAHAVELFSQLHRDLQKLSLGTYFVQVAEVLSQEDFPNPELLSLVLNSLYALSNLRLPESQIKAAFELRIACIAGYTPDLSGCHRCGNSSPDRFDLAAGRLECSTCRNPDSDGIRMPLTVDVLQAMQYICSCPSKKLLSFTVGESSLMVLSNISESYLSTQVERGFSALDFYKSLLVPYYNTL